MRKIIVPLVVGSLFVSLIALVVRTFIYLIAMVDWFPLATLAIPTLLVVWLGGYFISDRLGILRYTEVNLEEPTVLTSELGLLSESAAVEAAEQILQAARASQSTERFGDEYN